jgi:DNA-directed RNA polymerase subunit RPC12/RpoP
MRIKKFTCINCGAPKINEYKSPYVVCDYCGSFTDVDYTLGLDFWKESPEKTHIYQAKKIELYSRMQYALHKKDIIEYKNMQYEFWNYYYKTFPEYLPPSIDNDNKYKLYLKICADSSTKYAFEPELGQKGIKLNQLRQYLTYYKVGNESKVNSGAFFEMAQYYISYTKEGFKDFYDDKENSIMYELLPPAVHLKMKLSMFVQIWLPYLTETDADKFLKLTGFALQYMDIELPAGKKEKCTYCNSEIFIPEGSFKVYCESCHKKNVVQTFFVCSSCGAENSVPDNPAKPINCEYCGTENRLIKPLFG